MTTILRILLCGVVVVAPWWFGAVAARPLFYLGAVLVGIALLRFVQNLFLSDGPPSVGIPLFLIVPVGFLVLGVWQLSPSGEINPLLELRSAAFSDLLPGLVASPELSGFAKGLHTLSPSATQLMLAQLALALLAFWLSFELFEETESRRWLYLVLAVNGLAITGFGLAQQLTWNGKLFWTIPLRFGGSPFGPFVNRNNGAGYLLLTFACAVSSLVVAWFPLGMGEKPSRSGPWRERWSGWQLRVLGHVTPGILLSGLTVAVIAIGILMSLSRAGAAGLLAAALVLIPALNRWKTRMLVFVVAFVCLACGGLIWLGQHERIVQRLGTLASLSTALQGRVDHWQEAARLVQDFPVTGSGWGTYPLANPVYLSRNHGGWFQHAENQYLEVLAEAGIVGLVLFIAGWLLLAYASARAIRSDQAGRQLAAGLCGLLVVAGLSVISLTDFSLSIGSIVLTLAVLAGSVYAPFSKLQPQSSWILLATHRPRWRFLVSVGLLLTSGLAITQIQPAAAVEVVVDAIPQEGVYPTLEVVECDRILPRLEALMARYPERPEIYAAIAELRISRYRRMVYDDLLLNEPKAKKMGSFQLWGTTHLERLDAVITNLRFQSDADNERQLLARREIADNLPAALTALDRCVQLNPLQPGVSMPRAWLSHILNRPDTSLARDLAMFVGASDAEIQFQAGQLSQRIDQPEVNARCWKRCLELSDEWSTLVWNEATLTRDEAETLTLYPDRLEPLMRIIAAPRSLAVRRKLLERCQSIVAVETKIPVLSLARLNAELGDHSRAANAYLQAIRESPRDIGLRLEASVILERAGRAEMARTVVGIAHNLAPERSDVTARFESLISRERENVDKAPAHEN